MNYLFIDTQNRIAVINAWNPNPIHQIKLRANDVVPFTVYFLDVTTDKRAPYAIHQYATATVGMKLLDASNAAQATQATFSAVTPTATAPTVTRVVTGTSSIGEYDRITFASPPGSGSYNLVLKGGTVSAKGATSASSRIYPTVSSPVEASSAFASMNGAPWTVQFVSPTIVDVHGNAAVTGGTPSVSSVDVGDLGYLYGYTASLDLTPGGVAAIADLLGDTPGVTLAVSLTPSGGALQNVLKLPVSLFS